MTASGELHQTCHASLGAMPSSAAERQVSTARDGCTECDARETALVTLKSTPAAAGIQAVDSRVNYVTIHLPVCVRLLVKQEVSKEFLRDAGL